MRDKISDLIDDYGVAAGCLVVLLALVLIVGTFFLEGLIVWALWNAVVTVIFTSVPTISYWMALGIMILCNILFKGVASICKRD